mgnify:CR=1 FL=1
MKPEIFLKKLYKLCDGSKRGNELSCQFINESTDETIKDLDKEDFDFMNSVEGLVDIKKLSPEVMVGLLVWSFRWWDQVPNHSVLFNKISEELVLRKLPEERITNFLSGVKDGETYWAHWESDQFEQHL